VYALHIRSLGYTPIVYKLDRKIADEYGFETADTMDELVRNVKLCIIAGGALLKPLVFYKRWLKKDFIEFENDFRRMHEAGKKYSVKFCAISMGGDGKTRSLSKYFSKYRRDFFSSEYFLDGTVRLEGDVLQMKQFGKKFTYIPDCLFSLRKFLSVSPVEKEPGTPIRIGFNFRKRQIPKKFIEDVYAYAAGHSDMEFYFATTHMDKVIFDYGIKYEYLPNKDTSNVKFMHYEHPAQLLQFVADLDVFVASKLHLGLTGLLYGTPFVVYCGMGKAKTFLKSIGGDNAVLEENISFDSLVAEGGLLRKPKSELMRMYDHDRLKEMVDESWGQYEFCTKIVAQYA
jgi:hypothetical protein